MKYTSATSCPCRERNISIYGSRSKLVHFEYAPKNLYEWLRDSDSLNCGWRFLIASKILANISLIDWFDVFYGEILTLGHI